MPVVDLDVLAVGGAFGFFSVRFHWSPRVNKTSIQNVRMTTYSKNLPYKARGSVRICVWKP